MNNIAYYDQLAGAYDLFFRDLATNMEQEGDWLARVLRRRAAHEVLDASCGTGRQAIPLLERGFAVIGADPSSAMLLEAARMARLRSVDLPLVQSAFEGLSTHFGPQFDAVITLGNGLCNLESAEAIVTSLRTMRGCCRRGGVCVVGIKDFDRIKAERPRFHDHRVVDREGARTALFEVWDFDDPLLIVTTFVLFGRPDGGLDGGPSWEARTAETREYMAGREELISFAREAGFCTVERLEHPCEAVYCLCTAE